MPRDWTTTGFLATVKRRAFQPDAGGSFTDPELLSIGDEQLEELIEPAIIAVRENYFVDQADTSIVADQQAYRIPHRAIGSYLRSVTHLDSSSNGALMTWGPLEEVDLYGGSSYGTGYPPVFSIQDENVILQPTPTAAVGSLRFRYYRRPGKLVLTTAAAQVTGEGEDPNSITFSDVPSGWTTADTFDIIDADPPFPPMLDGVSDATTVDTSGNQIDSVTGLAASSVGDWWALAGESPIPQIPESMHAALALAVAHEVLLSIGDKANAKLRKSQLDEAIARGQAALSPRDHGASRRIRNRYSPLNSAKRRGWR